MKARISVTLSSDVVAKVDRLAGRKASRSTFIERILRRYFHELEKRKIHVRDVKRLNAADARLNAEANEVLSYQAFGR